MTNTRSIILIGMPASGKSTLGLLLAKKLGKDFIDTDIMIQIQEGKSLQDIVDEYGYQELRRIEESILSKGSYLNKVIATGGSAVYSDPGMQRLKQMGIVVYLKTSLEQLSNRLSDYKTRGIASHPNQNLADLFAERNTLYEKYADITIDCSSGNPDQIINAVFSALEHKS